MRNMMGRVDRLARAAADVSRMLHGLCRMVHRSPCVCCTPAGRSCGATCLPMQAGERPHVPCPQPDPSTRCASSHTLPLLLLQADVRLLIDAEHSYFQPAIDNTVTELQRQVRVHLML